MSISIELNKVGCQIELNKRHLKATIPAKLLAKHFNATRKMNLGICQKKMAMRKNIIAGIILLLCLTSCNLTSPAKEQPLVQQGIMDLQNWDFKSDGPVQLKGDWEFYWNALLESENFIDSSKLPAKTGFLRLPSMWNDFKMKGRNLPGIGYATLRMRLLIEKPPQTLAFKFKDVYSAYSIFVNGVKVGSSGIVSINSNDGFDRNLPQVIDFTSQERELEIIFQISNHTTLTGGSPQVILLGRTDDIHKIREKGLAIDLFIIGGILFMGLYHFGLFILRRKEKSTLYFMLHCFSGAVYGTVTGECFLPFYFPSVGMDVLMRIALFSAASVILWLMTFIHSVFPREFPKTLLQINNFIMGMCCLFAAVLPPSIYLQVFVVLQLVILFMLLSAIALLVRGVIRRQSDTTIVFAGLVLLTLTIINDALYYHMVIESTYLIPLGLFIFMFSQAFLLSTRFNMAFDMVETMSEQLEEKNRNLSRLDRLKNDFLSNTSHELRTPLNGIIGISESIVSGATGTISTLTKNHLSLIISSGKRLSILINDILDFSKLRNNEILLYKKPVDVYELVAVIKTMMNPLIQPRNIKIRNKISKTFAFVDADETRLQQILFNLIGNAVKFTEKGSVTITANQMDEVATIKISDTGVGIPEGRRYQIFDGFEQLNGSDEWEQSGAGLGLSITKKLVELHGGEISFQSTPGKGTDFSITLPVAKMSSNQTIPESSQDSQVPTNTPTTAETFADLSNAASQLNLHSHAQELVSEINERDYPELENISVLAVDDDPISLTVIRSFLSHCNSEVRTANSGDECLSILEQWQPDIILLDIIMPQRNGFITAQKIRERFGKDELPIIFLSGKNQVSDVVNGFQYEANDYIIKPFTKDGLLTRISFHVSMAFLIRDIKAAEHRIQQIFDNAVEGIFQISHENSPVYTNPAMTKLFGYQDDSDMLDSVHHIESLFEQPEDFKQIYQTLKRNQTYSAAEISFIRKNGTTFFGTISIQTFQDCQNKSIFAEGMIFDTTEHRQKVMAERQREVAEKANAAKSEFLTNISHELRTPMQGILGYARLGIDRFNNLSERKLLEYFQEIHSSGVRLTGLLNNLLDLSKLESNAVDFNYSSQKLSMVTSIVLGEMAAMISEKSLSVVFEEPGFDDTAIFDVEKIGQVIRNILGNAIKFSRQNGKIEISVQFNAPLLLLRISDNGTGIPEDELDSIFDKFVQSSKHKSGAGGTGLGLAISKGIIEDHRGKIWAENSPEGGAIFRFSIPLEAEEITNIS